MIFEFRFPVEEAEAMAELRKIFLSLVLCAAFAEVASHADHQKRLDMSVAAPPTELSSYMLSEHHSHLKGLPVKSSVQHKKSISFYNSNYVDTSHLHHLTRMMLHSSASSPSLFSPSYHPGHSYAPSVAHRNKKRFYPRPPYTDGPSISPSNAPNPSVRSEGVPAPSSSTSTTDTHEPTYPPVFSPSEPCSKKPVAPWPKTVEALPPPPPNLDCGSIVCTEPLTNTPPGSPCACVLPMKVGLQLNVALYAFFPLVSDLAQEIASGVLMELSQVRIMGANAASGEPEKTIVLINLVPRGEKFDNYTAFSTYWKLWRKQIPVKAPYFGNYDVLYVLYPGLPPPPRTTSGRIFGYGNNPMVIHPFAVDVNKPLGKQKRRYLAIIGLSSVITVVICVALALALFLRHRRGTHLAVPISQTSLPPFVKASGAEFSRYGSKLSSGIGKASMSSSIATYIGPVRRFSLSEIERTTNKFDDSRIIGEGGFGLVYEGTFEDGTRVAVKVLKRDDQQGLREFLAEVEMLSRLHHKNLVKLLGICTEELVRCLIYELIPNGSLESHLYGPQKETSSLDWNSRMKIALGTARCLAYLHEDSNPHVIHRDFKSSNILLENDFTPKLCDFGLARTALDTKNEHISTRVMGTFGYVAPEYAMTGHLLVKSDVYSYGVVLLELLTGRKPVDMMRPPGQENLVTWARPLLTSNEGLEAILDPSLGTDLQFDSLAKVAAIASMCVQPEVSQRPFMGEVVQALKLVCDESSEHRGSVSCSKSELCEADGEMRIGRGLALEEEVMPSTSDVFSISSRFIGVDDDDDNDDCGYLRRCSSSGPLRTERRKQLLQWVKGLSGGSISEHEIRQKRLEFGADWP